MIYQQPDLSEVDFQVLALIEDQRKRMRSYTENAPRRWYGSLRKNTFAKAIQGSNSIEGYNATIDEAVAAIDDETPIDGRTETWFAIKGYRDALTYILQSSRDQYFEFSKQYLKSLHFMMIGFDMTKNPGQWRPSEIYVVDKNGEAVYTGPPPEKVNGLVEELVSYLKQKEKDSIIVKAAMAHLNLTMIHPFRDGNGRMARALQTLVLAQEGIVHPVFSSIEEWLGKYTDEYYKILSETGKGKWNPANSALPWVRFCLVAHYQQAATLLRRHEEYSRLYKEISELVEAYRLNERVTVSLFNAALGLKITNPRYRAETEVSELIASRDLKLLCEKGLLEPFGERRGRYYRAMPVLKELRNTVRIRKKLENPYTLIAEPLSEANTALPQLSLFNSLSSE